MSSFKEKLTQCKLAFFDVDNTALYLHMVDENGKRIIGAKEYNDWVKYNIMNDAYENCKAPVGIKKSIELLHANGCKVYCLTECSNSFEYNSKVHCLKNEYPGIFTVHDDIISVDSRHKKIMFIKFIAERDNIPLEQICFCDDSYSEILEAFDSGIFAVHTTEMIERFMKD